MSVYINMLSACPPQLGKISEPPTLPWLDHLRSRALMDYCEATTAIAALNATRLVRALSVLLVFSGSFGDPQTSPGGRGQGHSYR